MTKEKEGFCVHVWIEDEPCHDVTQCLVHLSDYLQARGALQNLQRHNHESQEGNMRATSCYQISQSNSSLITCCHKAPALYTNSISFPSALPQHPFLSLQALFSLQPAHLLPLGHSRPHEQTRAPFLCELAHHSHSKNCMSENTITVCG